MKNIFALAALMGLFALPALAQDAPKVAPVAPAAEKKAKAPKNRLLMDAKINGKDVRFVFDTGAEGTGLTRTSAKRLGLKIIPTPQNGPIKPGEVHVDWAEKCELTIGKDHGEQTLPFIFGVVDIPESICPSAEFDGFFAWISLQQNVVLINAQQGQWQFTGSLLPESFNKENKWAKWKLIKNPRNLLIFESPNDQGEPVKIFIDTGNEDGISLSPKLWGPWEKQHPHPSMLNSYWSPGEGTVTGNLYRAKVLALGKFSLRDVPVQKNSASLDTAAGCDAILGVQALKQLHIIIDGKNGFLYTRPNPNPIEPYDYNLTGVTFPPRDPATSDDRVAHILKDGPAAKAGIQDGDLLLKEDGQDITKWRTDPAIMRDRSERVDVPNTKRKYTIQRGDQTLEFTVTLGAYPEAQ